MAETPDFDQIAQEIIAACVIERNMINEGAGSGTVPAVVANYLCQVWNARGAADLALFEKQRQGRDRPDALAVIEHEIAALDR